MSGFFVFCFNAWPGHMNFVLDPKTGLHIQQLHPAAVELLSHPEPFHHCWYVVSETAHRYVTRQ